MVSRPWNGPDSRVIIVSRMSGPKQSAPDQAKSPDELLNRIRVRTVGFATYLGCGNDAEDLAQATMMVLHDKYARVADAEELAKLATTICANLIKNWRRSKWNPAHADELSPTLADHSNPDPEATMELKDLLLKAIQESGKRCKELLRLRLDGATTKEIAARLGLSPGAVDTAYCRCVERLRGALGGRK
jgi:RNA polymerase sigma factor (sigma-70 family)